MAYFNSWSEGYQAELKNWLDQRDALLTGWKFRARVGVKQVSVQDACDFCLDSILDNPELADHWHQDIRRTCVLIKEVIGGHIAI